MLGLPTESEEEMWETIAINIQMKTDFPRATILTPMPNTKIVDIAKAAGYLDLEFSFDALPDSVFAGSILKNIDNDRVVNMLYFFQTLILFPRLKETIKRLMSCKPNVVFRLWFYIVYAYLHRKSEDRTWIPYLRYLLSNRKNI